MGAARAAQDPRHRQPPDRGTVGQRSVAAPRGWWARLTLVVIQRLEATLEAGFEVEPAPAPRRSWRRVAAWVGAAVGVGLLVFLVAGSLDGTSEAGTGTTLPWTFVVPDDPREVPPAVAGGADAPRGMGCDIAPAQPWWAGDDGPQPLADGAWFGRVLEVREAGFIFDVACYFHIPTPGGDAGTRIEPPGASVESTNAVLMAFAPDAVAHWPDTDKVYEHTDVETWLAAAAANPDTGQLPVLCPSGFCSVWAYVNGGVITEIVVVDFT